MVEIFSSFTEFLVIFGIIMAGFIVFEKKLIALEDKLDKWVAEKRHKNAERSGK